MVSIEGVDYSYARPSIAGLKSADKKFAVRYITTPGASNKGISKAEYDALHAAGIEVVVVWEGGAADMKKGKPQGVADAKAAQANLKAIVGLNDNLPVYFGCDFDATPADQAAINAYLDGAASVLGRDRVGMYAGYYPLKRAVAAGKVTWKWQTYAWSGGNILEGIHLYQYKNGVTLAGGQVDLVRALQTNYGQKGVVPPVAAAPAPAPAPAVVPAPVPVPEPVPAPVPAPAPAVPVGPSADELALAKPIQAQNGLLYIKGDVKPDIYIFHPLEGSKRHITGAEWTIIRGFEGVVNVQTYSQATIDAIPS